MREASFKTATVGTVLAKKVYFKTCGLAFTQNFEDSALIRGGSRHPVQSSRGTTDVAGDITTELTANSMLYFAGLGSMSSAMTGGTFGTALTTPTATIDSTNQIMTINATAHGLLPGDSVQIAGLTAPTSLNDLILPVFDVPTANQFKISIPIGTSTTYTLGSGTIKKVATIGTTLTHTLKAGGALPSYIIEKGFTDIAQYFKYMGCKCGKLGFTIPSSGMVDVSSTWMGGSEATASASFDTGTPTDNGTKLFDAFTLAAADVKEGSTPTAIATIKSCTITIDNDLDGDTFVVGGGGARAGINPGVYKISGTLECVFEDLSIYTKAKNLTESGLDFTFKRGTGAGTADNEYLQLITPEMIFVPKAPAIDGPKGVVASYDFSGYYDNHADATALKMIIKNVVLPGNLV
jgi:hypothetical protein